MFNGFQGPAEVIPFTDPLVAVPANLGPVTPWSVHITLAEATAGTGSVWVSWSTGVPTLLTNPAQTNESATGADIYVDDYPQPPTYNFIPRNNDSASVASLVHTWLAVPDLSARVRMALLKKCRPALSRRCHCVKCTCAPIVCADRLTFQPTTCFITSQSVRNFARKVARVAGAADVVETSPVERCRMQAH